MFTCPKSRNLCHQEVQKAPTETFYVVGIMDFLFMAAGITSYNIIKSTNRSDLLIMERCSDSYHLSACNSFNNANVSGQNERENKFIKKNTQINGHYSFNEVIGNCN